MPHGTMPPKWERSGATLSEKPCSVTQRFTRTPIAPIFGLAAVLVVGPDADAAVGAARFDPEQRQRVDHPAFERRYISAHVAPALCQVELDITDPLAGSVIGITPAAARVINGKARIEQFGGIGAGSRGVERRMFEQPDAFAAVASVDRGGARLHIGQRRGIVGQARGDDPFGERQAAHRAGFLPCRDALRKALRADRRQGWTDAPNSGTFAGNRDIRK